MFVLNGIRMKKLASKCVEALSFMYLELITKELNRKGNTVQLLRMQRRYFKVCWAEKCISFTFRNVFWRFLKFQIIYLCTYLMVQIVLNNIHWVDNFRTKWRLFFFKDCSMIFFLYIPMFSWLQGAFIFKLWWEFYYHQVMWKIKF